MLLYITLNTRVEVHLILIATVALGAYYPAFTVFMNIINVLVRQQLKYPLEQK